MENKIIIKLMENVSVEMSSDSPNIENLVSKIIEYRNTILIENIKIELQTCDDTDFDEITFKEIIVELVKDFLDKIEVNKSDWEQYKKDMLVNECE